MAVARYDVTRLSCAAPMWTPSSARPSAKNAQAAVMTNVRLPVKLTTDSSLCLSTPMLASNASLLQHREGIAKYKTLRPCSRKCDKHVGNVYLDVPPRCALLVKKTPKAHITAELLITQCAAAWVNYSKHTRTLWFEDRVVMFNVYPIMLLCDHAFVHEPPPLSYLRFSQAMMQMAPITKPQHRAHSIA